MTAQTTTKYPVARKGDVVDDYHGVKIADPYRWLEDTDSAETAEWVAAENNVTQAYLAGIPERARFKERLTSLYDYERFSAVREGRRRTISSSATTACRTRTCSTPPTGSKTPGACSSTPTRCAPTAPPRSPEW